MLILRRNPELPPAPSIPRLGSPGWRCSAFERGAGSARCSVRRELGEIASHRHRPLLFDDSCHRLAAERAITFAPPRGGHWGAPMWALDEPAGSTPFLARTVLPLGGNGPCGVLKRAVSLGVAYGVPADCCCASRRVREPIRVLGYSFTDPEFRGGHGRAIAGQPGCAVPPNNPAKGEPVPGSHARRPSLAQQRQSRACRTCRQSSPWSSGIGASAGGLTAFKTFFENMPPDSGMAFVLVQHLAPAHKSMLADLLGRVTVIPVLEAKDGMPAEANKGLCISPDATLTFKDCTLRVTRPAPPRERRRPIDTFFSSLAEDQGENAVCVVFSGTGSDGTLGLKTIKEYGGLVLAQADFHHMAMSGMPQSAAATGLVDDVIPVDDMPARLLNYQTHLLAVAPRKDGDGTRRNAAEHLTTIIAILRTRVGHDFSKYKERTLVRRIQRRMQVLQIDTVPAYILRLREDPSRPSCSSASS